MLQPHADHGQQHVSGIEANLHRQLHVEVVHQRLLVATRHGIECLHQIGVLSLSLLMNVRVI